MQQHSFWWAKISLAECHFIYWRVGVLSASQLGQIFTTSYTGLPGWVSGPVTMPALSLPFRQIPLWHCRPLELCQLFGFYLGQVVAAGVSGAVSSCCVLNLTGFQAIVNAGRQSCPDQTWTPLVTVQLSHPASQVALGTRKTSYNPCDRKMERTSCYGSPDFHSWKLLSLRLITSACWAREEKTDQENINQHISVCVCVCQSLSVRKQNGVNVVLP